MILCILKGILPFKMHKIIFFSENLKEILGFTSKCYPKHKYFLFGLTQIVSMDIFQKYGMSNSKGGNIVTSQDCFDTSSGKLKYIGGI